MQSTVNYDRPSQNPANFQSVFEEQMSLAKSIREGKVQVREASVEVKALNGATKALEVDVRARMFENQLRRQPELPSDESKKLEEAK